MQKVLVVDDSCSMRAALRWIINAQPGWHVCGKHPMERKEFPPQMVLHRPIECT